MSELHLYRSLIFVPGIRQNMIEKAQGFDADVIVLDLEDSVPPAEKEQARPIVRRAIPALAGLGHIVHVRVNPVGSGLARDDLAASSSARTASTAKASTPAAASASTAYSFQRVLRWRPTAAEQGWILIKPAAPLPY